MSSTANQRKALLSSDGRDQMEEENGVYDDDVEKGYRPPSLFVMNGDNSNNNEGDDDGGTIEVHTSVSMKECQQQEVANNGENKKDGRHDVSGAKKDGKEAVEDPTPSSSARVRIKDLKLLWILFQCFWPAVLLTFSDDITMSHVLLPYALTFWMVAYVVRGNILNEFISTPSCYKNFIPSIVWIGFYILSRSDLGESDIALVVFYLLILPNLLCMILGPKKIWGLGCNKLCQRLFIALSGKFDAFERWITNTLLPDSFPRPQDYLEVDGGSAPTDEIKVENLEHLEKLSNEGKLKRPTWVLVVLVIAAVWQFAFLFYFDDILAQFNTEGIYKAKSLNFGEGIPGYEDYSGGTVEVKALNFEVGLSEILDQG